MTKIEKFQDDGKSRKTSTTTTSTPSAKIIRRGSVKELKEKFVRKDSSSKVTESTSKRSSVDRRESGSETESYSVSKQYKTAAKESKSFLNSEKKASNVQEVLTFMKNADHGEFVDATENVEGHKNVFYSVEEEGDTKDDAEARALLNKFLGATALMTSIESKSGLSKEFLSSGGAKNQRVSFSHSCDFLQSAEFSTKR